MNAVPQAREIFASLDAPRVPGHVPATTGVWITNYRSFVKKWLQKRNYPAATLLGSQFAATLWLKDRMFAPRPNKQWRAEAPPRIEICTRFDERFDTFWDAVKDSYPGRLLPARSRRVLDWEFQHAIAEKRLWVALVGRGRGLEAYALFLLKRPSADGINRVLLHHFQCIAGREALFYPALEWGIRFCREQRFDLLEAKGIQVGPTAVTTLAPYRLAADSRTLLYKVQEASLSAELAHERSWPTSFHDILPIAQLG
jgi:hypothetical protein